MRNLITHFKEGIKKETEQIKTTPIYLLFHLNSDDFIFKCETNGLKYDFIISDYYFNFLHLLIMDQTNNYSIFDHSIEEILEGDGVLVFSFKYELEEYVIYKLKERILKL